MRSRSLARSLAFTTLTLATLAGSAFALQPAGGTGGAPVPAPVGSTINPPAAGQTPIVVLSVNGKVGYRASDGLPWQTLKPGMPLAEGGEIVTGPNASAVIQIGVTQQIQISRNSKVKLREVGNTGGTERSRIELPQGRLEIDVTSTQIKNDVQIATPDANIAVTGTGLIVDTNAGFDTYSQNKHGSYRVLFTDTQVLATLLQGDETSNANPDPAANQLDKLYLETNDVRSYDGDEQLFVKDFIIFGPIVGSDFGNDPGFGSLQPPTYFALNDSGKALFRVDLFGQSKGAGGLSGFSEGPVAGAPFFSQALGRLVMLAIENEYNSESGYYTPIIYKLDAKTTGTEWTPYIAFEPGGLFGDVAYNFQGIAALGGSVYVHGTAAFDPTPGLIFQIASPDEVTGYTPPTDGGDGGGDGKGGGDSGGAFARGELNESDYLPVQRMALGMNLQRGLASDNRRGTLFAVGSLPGETFGLGANRSFILVEVDPRNNYLAKAFTNTDNQFEPGPGSQIESGNLRELTQVTGLAYTGNTLVITGRTEGGKTLVLQYNPDATGGAGDPFVKRTRIDAKELFAAGAYRSGAIPQPQNLSEPTREVERDFINTTFADLAYSGQAARSGVVERIARNQVLTFARDPQGCIFSGQLSQLPDIIDQHIGQQSGMGQVIGQFRENLRGFDPNHPCLPNGNIQNNGRGR